MKKAIAALLSLITAISSFSVGAYAFFEQMSGEEINEALGSSGDTDAAEGTVLSWDFEGIATEDKTYINSILTEVNAAVKSGEGVYTVDRDAVGDFAGLIEVGTFKQRMTGRSFVLYRFSGDAAAQSAYAIMAARESDGRYLYIRENFVMLGDERLINKIALTSVNGAVKHGSYTSNGETVLGDLLSRLGIGGTSFMQFKTPDAAIRLENGEIIFGEACKDDGGQFQSIDAYMDVAVPNFNYDKAHSLIGGKSFVLSATLRAPQTDEYPISATMELFRTRSSFTGEDGERVTLDTVLAKYNIYTREISIYSAGEEIKTGIYLSDYAETTVAVHVHPASNSFDFYADGILVASNVGFLSSDQLRKVSAANGAAASGSGADYTPTMVRLFYSSTKALVADALCISDFSWYFSDRYLDKSDHSSTFAARSVEIADKVYFNLYLNFPRSVIGMGATALNVEIGGKTSEAWGEIVYGGELDGLVKYRLPVDFKDITEDITVTVASQDESEILYFYYSETESDTGFLAKTEYKTSALDYFHYLLAEENGYGDEVHAVARAMLNVGAYAQKLSGGYVEIPESELANYGYAYGSDELAAVDPDTLCAHIDSEIYKTTVKSGSVRHLTVTSASLVFDGAAYISVKYRYSGTCDLTVNGVKQTVENGSGTYKIQIGSPLNADGVYTVEFDDGESTCIMKIPPLYLGASVIRNGENKAQYIKVLYLYVLAAENYLASEGK